MRNYAIAIDGPASSGKSTVAKALADKLNIIYIDTGAMYRAITFLLLEKNIESSNLESISEELEKINFEYRNNNGQTELWVNKRNLTHEIRSVEVTQKVSEVSAIAIVRQVLVKKQQKIALDNSVVMDGRDIGTVVLPNAEHKFFLTASSKERAERRYYQNIENGLTEQTIEEIEADIIARDHYDSNREISPLKQAKDAVKIDTTSMSIENVIQFIIQHIDESLETK